MPARPDLALLCALWILLAAPLAADGLHNDTKTFTPDTEVTEADWSDPAEMALTWAAALVRVPDGSGGSNELTMAELARWRPVGDSKAPVVIYLHGCSGIWEGTRYRVRLMADMGFVAIAPASFARRKYPRSCDVATHRGGMYRGTLRIRQFDAGYAVTQARALPFVDPGRVILMGLSEGAITTATYESRAPQADVTHRIIEGWTCNAGWLEYHGLNAGPGEPVLSLLAADDPWFQLDVLKGDCGPKMAPGNGSRSVVFSDAELARRHDLLDHPRAQSELKAFLAAQNLLP